MLRILFCITLAATLLNACTIEKRTFNKGWHVEWKQRHASVANLPEKEAAEKPSAEIREATAIVPVIAEELAETASPEENTIPTENEVPEAISSADAVATSDAIENAPDQLLSTEQSPAPDEIDDTPAPNGLWWLVALLVGIALAATIWLSVGTGGSGALLVVLFVALVGAVAGAIALSMYIKKTTPKEEEVDIQFDELTENEIKRKKKIKGLIAALVLVIVGVGIILLGSK